MINNLPELRITIIYDNNPSVTGLKHGFGFSCLLEQGDNQIIFDTGGDKEAFFYNIQKLSIKLDTITHIVFSHQHWDHTAGFKQVIQQLDNDCKIYIPFKFDKNLWDIQIATDKKLIKIKNITELTSNIFSSVLKGNSCIIAECFSVYEQFLTIETSKGLVVLTGCAHPGIKNILRTVKNQFKNDIYWVIGGFHLHRSFTKKIKGIIDEFNLLNIANISPCHCTGEKAFNMFKEMFDNNLHRVGVGSIMYI